MITIRLGYIQISDWDNEIPYLFPDWMLEDTVNKKLQKEINSIKLDDVVTLPNTIYTLTIDYPLTNPFYKEFKTGKKGMTRKGLINLIVKSYRKVYKEEDSSSKIKAGWIPNMLNRNGTDGKYGIWGHVLEDLMLHTATVNPTSSLAKNKITLGVDS